MRFSRHVSRRVRFPRDFEFILRPLVERLLADDTDADTLQIVLREHAVGERPSIAILRGTTSTTYIEGPQYTVDGHNFALGARICTELGWVHLDPILTAELRHRVREETDRVVMRLLAETGRLTTPDPCRTPLNRATDDERAIATMVAWAQRNRRIDAMSHDL
jgi:hypothetical protein